MNTVKVRFPPSPTGYCHVGTARMAVVNFLFARKHGGTIVFRSEDTDRERSKKEYEDDILESLAWLGLSWDEFYRQTERTQVYAAALIKLIDEDKAYLSEEESKKEPGVMTQVVRLRNPGKVITFTDVLRGDITFDTTELGDFVIARSLSDPLYHLAVVIDDGDMGITHVIRGEDHISNTPRQILIQEALGYARPVYAHYPLHLAADRSKLSKRKGDVAVRSYREKGYLPEALLNYLAHLGWTPPSGRELMSLADMIAEFELTDIHKSGAVFDIEKLRWYNREYLLALSPDLFDTMCIRELSARLQAAEPTILKRLVPHVKERISVWSDLDELIAEGEFVYAAERPQLDPTRIPDKKSDAATAHAHLTHINEALAALPDDSDADAAKAALWDYATEKGRGAVLWPMRYALSGRDRSLDPFALTAVLGIAEARARIKNALSVLDYSV